VFGGLSLDGQVAVERRVLQNALQWQELVLADEHGLSSPGAAWSLAVSWLLRHSRY